MKLFNIKPSIKEVAQRLAQVGVLVADGDPRIAQIVKEVLESLGFRSIFMARDGTQALHYIRSSKVDLVITDWRMEPMDGFTMAQYLRMSPESPNRFIPILMLTGNADREDVEQARDIGITEFVVKPFSAKTLCDRLVLIIENPRSFVMSKSYIGPDRRRRRADNPHGIERRTRK